MIDYILVVTLVWILSFLTKKFLFNTPNILLSILISLILGFVAFGLYYMLLANYTIIENTKIGKMSLNIFIISIFVSFMSLRNKI